MPGEENFKLIDEPIPSLGEGQVLVETSYLSVDPYMRGRISSAKSYAKPVEIGEVMTGGAVGKVLASSNPKFAAGDLVEGMFARELTR